MDFSFLGASMGSVVGERFRRAVEHVDVAELREGHAFAGVDDERDVVEQGQVPVGVGDVVEREERHAILVSLSGPRVCSPDDVPPAAS